MGRWVKCFKPACSLNTGGTALLVKIQSSGDTRLCLCTTKDPTRGCFPRSLLMRVWRICIWTIVNSVSFDILSSFLLNLVPLSDYSWSTGPGKAGLRVENSTFRIAWFPPRKGLTGWHPHRSVSVYSSSQPAHSCLWVSHRGLSLCHIPNRPLYGFLVRLYGIASGQVLSWELIFSRVVSWANHSVRSFVTKRNTLSTGHLKETDKNW